MKTHQHRHSSRLHFYHKYHIKNILLLALSCCIILAGLGILWLSTLKIPDLHAFEARKVAQSTKIYDRTGEIVLYDIHQNAKRTVVALSDISPYIQKGTIAIEDNEFYSHFGIQPKAILRALLAVLTSGSYSQGGSTITQQVVKNAILTTDKTLTRKLKEWVIAIKLERVLTKDQILETYLNETPYGGNIYGVEEASKTFYGKDAKDVTIAEAAYIAAVAQAPTYYSPYGTHQDALLQRKNLVLRKMYENKFIDDAQYKAALAERVRFLSRSEAGIKAAHFSLFVKDYLVEKYGEDFVQQGGLKVITTLDYKMQKTAEDTVKNYIADMRKKFDDKMNTALVAIDPKTGDILSMVGSRDYFDTKIDGNYNITTADRQPGSSFKPFVYATAFNKGYTPDTELFDIKTEFSSSCTPQGEPKTPDAQCYSPDEYDHEFPGPMTMRYALAQSRNIPAVKTLYLSGIKDSLKTAADMGIGGLGDANQYGLTLVLGGGEVKLLDLTSAYSVFANDGERNPYRSILRIEDSKGNIIEESKLATNQVLPKNTVRQISDILSDESIRIATIRDLLKPSSKQIAVKTGTTNDYRDVWTMGYTPQLAVGVWAGHNDNTPIDKSKTAGLVITPLWAAFMLEATKDMPNENFEEPEPVPTDLKPVLRGHWEGGESYFIDTASGNRATDSTPPEFKQEVIVNNVHSILYWVNKDDPRGPVPSNPQNDSQFASWEYGVKQWYENWKISHPNFSENQDSSIPSTIDTSHSLEHAPTVRFNEPRNSTLYKKTDKITTNISITQNSENPITKADYYLNGRYLSTTTQTPFNISFVPQDIKSAIRNNELRVIVYDSILNKGEATTRFRTE